jgi:hypothetical protein
MASTTLLGQGMHCLPRTITLKRHDTGPRVELLLVNDDETPFDLTGYSDATFILASRSPSAEVLIAAAAVVDVASGSLRYTWLAGDTDLSGDFDAEFEVFDLDGRRRTFPPDAHIWVQVLDDLDDA